MPGRFGEPLEGTYCRLRPAAFKPRDVALIGALDARRAVKWWLERDPIAEAILKARIRGGQQ
jgi:hypothetical protein